MDEKSKSCVLFFVKAPVEGAVKTRLAAQIGDADAMELYKCFVLDTLSCLERIGVDFQIHFFPEDRLPQISGWLGPGYRYMAQRGGDLGERMSSAFANAFADGLERVAIIGSDSPDLPTEFLAEALDELRASDAVIGPSSDGGYYLIGFQRNRFLVEAFDDISWGNDSVFEQTMNILQRCGRKVHLLPKWHDVDTIEDIKLLLARNRNGVFKTSKTFSYLAAGDLWGGKNDD